MEKQQAKGKHITPRGETYLQSTTGRSFGACYPETYNPKTLGRLRRPRRDQGRKGKRLGDKGKSKKTSQRDKIGERLVL